MEVLIVGLGSMGKRRMRLIRENFKDFQIYGVDTKDSRRQDVEIEFGVQTFSSISDAFSVINFNCAFVCTSPLSHATLITDLLSRNAHVFTEINLVTDGYLQNIALAKKNNRILFLSSTFLYRSEIQNIIGWVSEQNSPFIYSYHVGQYLPDWHPWENYRDFFVSHPKTNGCRELLALELPWLISAFGPIEDFEVLREKLTSLDLPYPDSYFLTLKHTSGHIGKYIVDLVTRIPVRHFEAFSESFQIEWRGTPESLYRSNETLSSMINIKAPEKTVHQDGYRSFITENAYLNEISAFFNLCNGGSAPYYSFEEDYSVLSLIDIMEDR